MLCVEIGAVLSVLCVEIGAVLSVLCVETGTVLSVDTAVVSTVVVTVDVLVSVETGFSITSISPGIVRTLPEISNPSSSNTLRSVSFTGIFEPGVASASTLYVSSTTTDPSGATCALPVPDANKNLAMSSLNCTSAP